MGHTCLYCEQWMGSRVVGTTVVGKVAKLTKHCVKRRKDIESNSRPCRRFKPATVFYCNKLNCRKHLLACLHGHAYSKHGKYPAMYGECEKCRQYQITIKPMCDKYGIETDRQVAVIPREKNPPDSKLPRRGKKKNGMPKDFVLPRRKSKPKKEKPSKLPRRRKKKPDIVMANGSTITFVGSSKDKIVGTSSKLPRRREKKITKLPRRRRRNG